MASKEIKLTGEDEQGVPWQIVLYIDNPSTDERVISGWKLREGGLYNILSPGDQTVVSRFSFNLKHCVKENLWDTLYDYDDENSEAFLAAFRKDLETDPWRLFYSTRSKASDCSLVVPVFRIFERLKFAPLNKRATTPIYPVTSNTLPLGLGVLGLLFTLCGAGLLMLGGVCPPVFLLALLAVGVLLAFVSGGCYVDRTFCQRRASMFISSLSGQVCEVVRAAMPHLST